jgi:hypothetical protein
MPTIWSVAFLIWGQASSTARAMSPPPLFPKKQVDAPMVRQQEDMVDLVMDEASLPPGTQLPAGSAPSSASAPAKAK